MLEKCLTWRCCHWVHLHPTMRKETERGQTEGRCDDWVVDFPPEWNHMELTSQWSPSCPSVSHCSLGMVAVGSGTEGQVHMEHFDSVALTPGPGGEGTGKGGIKKENWVGGGRSMGNWVQKRKSREEDISGVGTDTVLFYIRSNWKHIIKAGGRIQDGKKCTLLHQSLNEHMPQRDFKEQREIKPNPLFYM